MRYLSFFIILFILCFTTSNAQEKQPYQEDSLSYAKVHYSEHEAPTLVERDTTRIFKNFEQKSKKTKVGRFINKLVYKNNKKLIANAPDIKTNQHLELGEGKVIRNIYIKTLDPFGFSDTDSLKKPKNKVEEIGNKLHFKSKNFTIKNFLIFKEGDRFDSLKIKESERLLRTQSFVRKVTMYPIPTSHPDSVDVLVRELDSWSIYPTGSISTSSYRIKLRDRNFAGLGHDVILQYTNRYKERKQGVYFDYTVNNIQNTFIRANLLYNKQTWGDYVKGVVVDRPFYSPYTKWAGGVTLSQNFRRDSLPDINNNYSYESRKYNTVDTWGGYSIPLFKSYKDKPVITNLRTSLRYIKQNYTESPQEQYDPYGFYRDQSTYLASVSLSSINYVQDQYIFNYNIIEDVQVGKVFALTGGMRDQYGKRRAYYGAKLAMGGYTRFGYFSGNIEWGSYFYGSNSEQGALRLEGTYFTKLFMMGNWRFRHFFTPQFIYGYNRYDHIGDELRLDNVIQGIRAQKVTGSKRLAFAYQWQSYAPYEWKGFRFNPYFSFEGAFITNKSENLFDSKFYSRFSIGLVAYNDYLVFSKVALSLVFYPTMPDSGSSVIKANSRQYNMNLPDFNYDRPRTVSYY
ncbi:hypothetical protein [Myroides odoratimimus]|uniref:Outer membrane protein/protective antigen OMA87 n=1 Tax=Myroides odoratimimus TaxID=76832 RepID=A0AAI8C2C9_9FLAO|nr:hypothetical protein [Myroides odoratimimus]ALU24761.1 hypothetical protein AS202_00480 [Myroides odoratimimus]MCS7473995.1 hypothetical protein [Myroides odoratimimus]MDM1034506.1 hypothetical protein [Myroides odoratimimus]MDM1036822.1 hypothetical protein [Myroides odoratimimus]MDM1051069.1 hypothetical protein [Myroides odoratimimus]